MNPSYVNISSYSRSSSFVPLYPDDIKTQLLHVQRIGLTYCKEDYMVRNRNIDSYLICYVFKGEGYLDYNDGHYFLQKGDLFIIDCHQTHSYYPKPQNPFALLFLHFQGPFASMYTHTIIQKQILLTQMEITQQVRKEIATLYGNFKQQIHPSPFQISTSIYTLLVTLLSYTKELQYQEIVIPSPILSAAKYIEENFTQTIVIPNLAKQVSMSEYHFIREFSKYYHQSPYEYVLYCRFHHSKELLLKTNMSITEIADFLQFHSLSHYVSFFKKRESMTPLQFRKRYVIKT